MKIIFLICLFFYLILLIYIYFTQNSKIFNIAQIEKREPFLIKNSREITLKTENGITLNGLYRKADMDNASLLIYFGGNSDDATRFLLYVNDLKDFDIVVFNYRGYLKSEGKPSEKNLFNDALKIYDTFSKNRRTIIVGRSLGTGVAVYLASKRRVDGTILITPFDSIVSLAKDRHPLLPVSWLLKHKFDSVKYVQQIKSPIAVIEVKDDKTVLHKHTLKLIKKIKKLALHVELKDTTHADILSHPDFEKNLKEAILKF